MSELRENNNSKKIFDAGVLLASIILCFYILLVIVWTKQGTIYKNDFIAFWGAGKIASEKSFTEIYSLEEIKQLQSNVFFSSGFINASEITDFQANPFPVFSIFVVPFVYLGRFSLKLGFWVWTGLNVLFYLLYVFFFIQRTSPSVGRKNKENISFFLVVVFFPVFNSIINGQIDIFLLICMGEWLRNSFIQRTYISGIWLGGFLLKPQALILIIPVLFFYKEWKTLLGFLTTCIIVVFASICISGFQGIVSLIQLWMQYASGIGSNCPLGMINWRMIALFLSESINSNFSWMIAGLGSLITLIITILLINNQRRTNYPDRTLVFLGVMAATLALTWHAHYHMAAILTPFMIYAYNQKLLPRWLIIAWGTVTPFLWLLNGVVVGLMTNVLNTPIPNIQGTLITFSGFIMNLVTLIACLRFEKSHIEEPII